MSGTLYVVPTPLGNLEDMTLRGIRILGEVALIAAEDTRRSRILLNHFGIQTKLVSYHQHSKRSKLPYLLEQLESADIAVVSDAGMPSVADPGFELIRAAIDQGYTVDVLPGPSAPVTAAVLAALPSRGYVAMGFLPRTQADAVGVLAEVRHLPYALVVFESPSRVGRTMSLLHRELGDRPAVATRELSKLHQEVLRGTLGSLSERLKDEKPRGEWTVVVGGAATAAPAVDNTTLVETVSRLIAAGETQRDAIRLASEILDVPRSAVYSSWLSGNDSGNADPGTTS